MRYELCLHMSRHDIQSMPFKDYGLGMKSKGHIDRCCH